jgi:NitT/TauT family transport system substrate-binding protein
MDFILGVKHAPWFVALEKGFYAKRGLAATIQAGTGSADTVRSIAAVGADFGFADISTAIVARSRGTGVVAVGQLGYVGATILWRDEGVIKSVKDLEGKSLAISPGQAQWFLLPAYCRINKIDFKSIRIQETAAPLQPAALVAKKADFIIMFRASNDEVAEQAARDVAEVLVGLSGLRQVVDPAARVGAAVPSPWPSRRAMTARQHRRPSSSALRSSSTGM